VYPFGSSKVGRGPLKRNVLIVAAPFGFGPAARSLIVAEGLKDVADVSFFSDGDAHRFIEKYKPATSSCASGIFAQTFQNPGALQQFDLFICVNQAPAFEHLGKLGRADRTVFLDSILRWRTEVAGTLVTGGLAYLAEDYPGAEPHLDRGAAQRVELTAPLVWPSERTPSGERRGITLHLGGATSPLAPWEAMARPIEMLAKHAADLARRHDTSLTVIGSAHLKRLPPLGDGVTVLGDVSPERAASLIGNSVLLVSTPGVGAVNEAIARATPIALLSPMSSTQLLHYNVLTQHGVSGVLEPDLVRRMSEITRTLSWTQQTQFCLKLWSEQTARLLMQMPRVLGDLLNNETLEVRNRALSAQRSILAGLSRRSAIDVIKDLLAGY
jgi:hypothetical protein